VTVVDTSVWVDYFNGVSTPQTGRLDRLLGEERVIMGDLILTEVLQGFRSDADFRRARTLLEALELRAMLGKDLALESARNYRRLRRLGVAVRKTIDVMIGTFCIANALPLLHADRDFEPLAGHLGLHVVAT
jgi:hypothetical protein